MNSQGYKLRTELNDGLVKYGEDNNISPISIIEELVEDFLCQKDYLCSTFEPCSSEVEKIRYTNYDKRGKVYNIQKSITGGKYNYGSSKSPVIVKEIICFLESVEWDIKYSTKNTGLRGTKQINFLLNEMEKFFGSGV